MQDDKLKLHKIKLITSKITSSRTKLGKILGFEAPSCFREAHKALVEAKCFFSKALVEPFKAAS